MKVISKRFQIDLMSMLSDFIFTTCKINSVCTGANSADNACFSLPFSPQKEFFICLLEPNWSLDYLNCTEQPDHNTEANTAGLNCIFCPALNVFKCTECQWGRDGRMDKLKCRVGWREPGDDQGRRWRSRQHGPRQTGTTKPRDQIAATSSQVC